MQELTDVIRSLANGKALELDRFLVGLLQITLNGDPPLQQRLLDFIVSI